ncbi:hypothetical protein P692DRAFT_20851003 [Suillus brevipes Sb2]|nr:hypothetical protein P692DRAFT_20851003 [Suillus brevipes Sb2]
MTNQANRKEIHKEKLNFRQRVIATAILFISKFYIKNPYCETDPFIVIAACCYVAGKAEELPVHIKIMVAEARLFFSHIWNSTSLQADLEYDPTVFHPYRPLLAICKKKSSNDLQTGAGEVGVGVDDGPRSIINDTYCSDLCLLGPPHLIAITTLFLAVVLHGPTRELLQQRSHSFEATPVHSSPRRSSRPSSSTSLSYGKKPSQDFVAYFAELNVSMPLVATYLEDSDLYMLDDGLVSKVFTPANVIRCIPYA